MYLFVKTAADRLLAAILLVITLPIMLICALSILISDGVESPLFTQKRVGQDNKVFTIYKFRSMRAETIRGGKRLTDSERLFKVGKLIRKLSFDEFPQFFNILRGDMSFIGPRPLPTQYIPYYTTNEKRRHNLKPGISGWAQVNGRNKLNWEEKFLLDLYYVDNVSLPLDLKILILTIKKVFLGADVGVIGENSSEIDFDKYRKIQKGDK